jgi:hypothetical protein
MQIRCPKCGGLLSLSGILLVCHRCRLAYRLIDPQPLGPTVEAAPQGPAVETANKPKRAVGCWGALGVGALALSLVLVLAYMAQTLGDGSVASAPGPHPTSTPGRRPATGQTHFSRNYHALGSLEVDNGTSFDGFVRLSTTAYTPVVAAGSVRSHGTLTLKYVPDGTYWLWFCTGSDWRPRTHDFVTDYRCYRFEESLRFSTRSTPQGSIGSGWEVTLHRTAGGNAETVYADPDTLPPLG